MNWILIAAAWTLLCVQGATAQTIPPSRGFVVVNGGFQLTANDFSDSATKRENAEDGSLNTAYVVQKGPAFDIAAGGIIKGRLAVGAGVSRFQVATPSSLTASVPHPFFFNRPRTVSGTASGLSREELAVHVHAGGTFPIGTRVQVMVFGGPSLFKVRQGLVTDFSYSDSYPYDDATFASATTGTSNVSKIGFNGGGDLSFFFTRQIGLGVSAQFAGTTVELPAAGGGTQEVKVGGLKAGGGLRLRF